MSDKPISLTTHGQMAAINGLSQLIQQCLEQGVSAGDVLAALAFSTAQVSGYIAAELAKSQQSIAVPNGMQTLKLTNGRA